MSRESARKAHTAHQVRWYSSHETFHGSEAGCATECDRKLRYPADGEEAPA
jgi:hypothetical protein